jgi:hypothetical protein
MGKQVTLNLKTYLKRLSDASLQCDRIVCSLKPWPESAASRCLL